MGFALLVGDARDIVVFMRPTLNGESVSYEFRICAGKPV